MGLGFLTGTKKKASIEELERSEKASNVRLRKIVGYGMLSLMAAQVVLADGVFLKYAGRVGWGNLEVGAIQAWLAATVIQVVGVVTVITKSLFPAKGAR